MNSSNWIWKHIYTRYHQRNILHLPFFITNYGDCFTVKCSNVVILLLNFTLIGLIVVATTVLTQLNWSLYDKGLTMNHCRMTFDKKFYEDCVNPKILRPLNFWEPKPPGMQTFSPWSQAFPSSSHAHQSYSIICKQVVTLVIGGIEVSRERSTR